MKPAAASFLLRSCFTVLAVVAIGIALSQQLGLSMLQSMLISLPIGFFAASLFTLWAMARAGAQGNKTGQLFLILGIELLLVPLASAAAIAAYFVDRQ